MLYRSLFFITKCLFSKLFMIISKTNLSFSKLCAVVVNIWSILKFLFIYLVNMFIIYILNLLLNINSFLILPIGYIESVSDNCCKLFSVSVI